MSYLLFLAFHNVLRYKRRTLLTFLVISFGIAFFIVLYGMVSGARDKSYENVIKYNTAHLKIRSAAYDEDAPYARKSLITDAARVLPRVQDFDFVTAYSPRLKFRGELDNYDVTLPIEVIGLNPAQDKRVFNTLNFISEGKFSAEGLVIGVNIAKDMGLKVGDFVYLTFRTLDGGFDSIELPITGIIDSPDPTVNFYSGFISLALAQKFLNTRGITEIAVLTDELNRVPEYRDIMQSRLGPTLKVWTWRELGASAIAAAEGDTISIYIYVFFIAIVAMVGVVNTMLMSVLEKKREIGVLKALGMTDSEVAQLFVFEGSLIGLLGSVFGVLLGVVINWYFVVHGIDYSSFVKEAGGNIGYQILGVVKSNWNVNAIFFAALTAIVLSALASYFPAKRVAKMDPAQCIRTV